MWPGFRSACTSRSYRSPSIVVAKLCAFSRNSQIGPWLRGGGARVEGTGLDQVRERAALDQLHRDVEMAVAIVAEVVDRRHHAVRVLEALLQHRAVTLGGDALDGVGGVGQAAPA